MDTIIRILIYLSIGSGLLGANLWFFGTVYKAFFNRGVVIASFKIIGKEDDESKLGINLANRLRHQLIKIPQELEDSQSLITQKTSDTKESESSGVFIPIVPIPSLKKVTLPTQIFEPLNIKVEVAGVEVSEIIPWLQRWIVSERTLSFTVYYKGNKAKVAGNFGPFAKSKSELLWLEDIEANNDDGIVNSISYQLILNKLSEDQKRTETLDLPLDFLVPIRP